MCNLDSRLSFTPRARSLDGRCLASIVQVSGSCWSPANQTAEFLNGAHKQAVIKILKCVLQLTISKFYKRGIFTQLCQPSTNVDVQHVSLLIFMLETCMKPCRRSCSTLPFSIIFSMRLLYAHFNQETRPQVERFCIFAPTFTSLEKQALWHFTNIFLQDHEHSRDNSRI